MTDQKLWWASETIRMINELTPDIKGKAFDPGWFLLRERLEEAGRVIDAKKNLTPDENGV